MDNQFKNNKELIDHDISVLNETETEELEDESENKIYYWLISCILLVIVLSFISI